MGERPHVRTDPAVRFGQPHVRGVSAELIAEQVWAGADAAELYAEYGLSRGDVLVACWHQGIHGTRAWRRRWGAWARGVHPGLARVDPDYAAVEMPPARTDAS